MSLTSGFLHGRDLTVSIEMLLFAISKRINYTEEYKIYRFNVSYLDNHSTH